MVEVCRACSLPAVGTNTYVCGGSCKAAYHCKAGCMGVPASVLKELKRPASGLSWRCPDCLVSPRSEMAELRDLLTSSIDGVRNEIMALERRLTFPALALTSLHRRSALYATARRSFDQYQRACPCLRCHTHLTHHAQHQSCAKFHPFLGNEHHSG
ncbi:Chromatin remodeling factor CHD3 (PICKLE) isoform 1 [Anopheles sinensis]|uniref:Chromatin remodeling factor CHD3 (PICKLE) isoform 1 n=1 Tax=Anopheles sinensis TaxID=74873 RepID=A0A084WCA9_ANOSI|nr:Chromatin remodeling factor CHD3 (PICKLE) isoform 1 [Anopheles sinensis]